MKRIMASIGVATLGAACVQYASAQADQSRPWSTSLALRGFYDDNINTVPNSAANHVESFGFELNPRLAYALRGDQTTAALVYTYGFRYFETKPSGNSEHFDQTHTIAGTLTHSFDERTAITITDSFVIGQEPDELRSGANPGDATFQRISGQNIVNYGGLTLNHQFAPKFGVELGYQNSLWNYEDDTIITNSPPSANPFSPSQSGLLDRIMNNIHIDARWTIQPATVGLIGYAFQYDHYTADQPIGFAFSPTDLANSGVIYSDDRDERSHYAYAGVEHAFLPTLKGSLRAGARFTDYFNSPTSDSGASPYVLATLTYEYAKEGSFQIGVSHDLTATDAFTTDGTSFTSDSTVTVAFLSISHRLLPSLTGTLMGQFQNSTFNGGQYNGESEQYYLVSAGLTYEFNRHLSALLSYHYDLLDSTVPDRGFDRNRVFLGLNFTY